MIKQSIAVVGLPLAILVSSIAAKQATTDSGAVGSCKVAIVKKMAFFDMMPSPTSRRGSGDLVAKVTVDFDNAKGSPATMAVSGSVLDVNTNQISLVWQAVGDVNSWDGKIGQGETKTVTFRSRLANHSIRLGTPIKLVVAIEDDKNHKVELVTGPIRTIGAR